MGWKGSRRGGEGGRGRGPARPNDLQRQQVAATLIDAAARRGLQATDAGTGWPPQMQFLFACTDGDLDRVKGKILLRNGVASR
ncbi:hypothetical protein ACQ4PT_037306 [Festuca glaucescens]